VFLERIQVYQIYPPERVHVLEELNISCCNLKLPQPPHAGRERLRRLITRLRLCRDKQPPIYAGLLFLEAFSLLSNGGGMAVCLFKCLRMVSSGIIELCFVSYMCYFPRSATNVGYLSLQ
jgi:hypothetical protein